MDNDYTRRIAKESTDRLSKAEYAADRERIRIEALAVSKHLCGENYHPRHPADCYYCRLALDNQINREIAARGQA